MSTHAVRVIRIKDILPHPNADRLEIIPIPGPDGDVSLSSWRVVSQKGQFAIGDLAIYIEPDYIVPTDMPEFSFLAQPGKTHHRLKAIKLRGEVSFGLLIPAVGGYGLAGDPSCQSFPWEVGMDVMEYFGITRYEPTVHIPGLGSGKPDGLGLSRPWPVAPKFDVDSLSSMGNMFWPGETVVVTEKIHGANARFLFQYGEFYVGSRNRWMDPDKDHLWTRVIKDHGQGPGIERWCRANEGTVLYGEVFGPVQSLKYGHPTPQFAAFAAYEPPGRWMDYNPFAVSCLNHGVKTAPCLYVGPWLPETILPLAELDTAVSAPFGNACVGHMREGIVIHPVVERTHGKNRSRAVAKHISTRYWTSKLD